MRIKLKFMLPNIETACLARKEVLAASIDDFRSANIQCEKIRSLMNGLCQNIKFNAV
jgi:hypothetical protein